MLRLNHSTVVQSSRYGTWIDGTFDEITKTGKVKIKGAEQFRWQDGILELNGTKHEINLPFDIDAEPEQLMYWFKRVTSSQGDMFAIIDPPSRNTGDGIKVVDINDLKWEYPEYEWRAVDKNGTIPYFKTRPTIDNAGFWLVYDNDEYPKYSDYLASNTDDYKRSLRRQS